MKIKRLRKSRKGRIEIIPMIDVMFFLLATFILASLSMQNFSGVAVNLTKGSADKISDENQITLTVTHDNSVFFNKEPIAIEAIAPRLRSISDDKKNIIIAADKNSLQGVVMQVMLSAREGGAQHFSIISSNQ
jgi:biopolymer transport protein ExbD